MDQLNKERDRLMADHAAQTGTKWGTYNCMKAKDEAYQEEFNEQIREIRELSVSPSKIHLFCFSLSFHLY
jgi:hypothetical protein